MIEKWKPILETDSRYSISNLSRVRNNKTNLILKAYLDKDNYYRTTLRSKTKQLNRLIHRLVAQHFISNPDNKATVNHIDGNKQNNSIKNLQWCSNQENIDHAWGKGLMEVNHGEKHPNAKLTKKDVIQIKSMLKLKINRILIAKKFKISKTQISNIARGTSWRRV